ncbi:inositolhexakisphosphate/diphosphoinositol-pentakisphosphatekinase, partial [Monoraphidium neglectum]
MDGHGTPVERAARVGSAVLTPHSAPGHKGGSKRKGMKRSSSAPNCNRPSILPIKVGICAMDKKATSKPMREITGRLTQAGEFEIIVFGDKIIQEEPVEKWPLCDVLLSWHSDGFPLRKAQAYAALRRPFMVNDVGMQDMLLDRRRVYKLLQDSSIPVPTHIVVSRDRLPPGEADPPGFLEGEDYVELDGVRIEKPFVEKPVSGEDHNIYIYYPHSMGGGVKRLFRKVENKSADYDPNHPGTVRRLGSFIYEQFLTTGGTDVKVYTVGPRYAHAEARKSPVVDGKVNRDAEGKEVRFPVLLSPQEKEIARMVCAAFGQRVCGFDLLRSENGRSYVCDVNGWSFVKNSKKYYDDTADVLRTMILSQLAPHRLAAIIPEPLRQLRLPEECGHAPEEGCSCAEEQAAAEAAAGMREVASLQDMASMGEEEALDDDDSSSTNFGGEPSSNRFLELRCVLAVVRHGDRTPKQKMKMPVTQPAMLELFNKHKDSKGKQAKLKSPLQLQELLDVTRQLLADMERQQKAAARGPDGGAAGEEERDQL